MYKIVEEQEGVFKIYWKGWFFWNCFKYNIGGRRSILDAEYSSLEEAAEKLKNFVKAKAKPNPKFKKKTYNYREVGEPYDNWLPPLGIGR